MEIPCYARPDSSLVAACTDQPSVYVELRRDAHRIAIAPSATTVLLFERSRFLGWPLVESGHRRKALLRDPPTAPTCAGYGAPHDRTQAIELEGSKGAGLPED